LAGSGPGKHQKNWNPLLIIIQSHSRPFPQTAVPLLRSLIPLPADVSSVPVPIPRTHFLIPTNSRFVMYAMYHSLCKTDTRPTQHSGCFGAENLGSTWCLCITRGTVCYQRSCSEMLSPAAASSLTDRQTAHCDMTVAAPTDNFYVAVGRHMSDGEGIHTQLLSTNLVVQNREKNEHLTK